MAYITWNNWCLVSAGNSAVVVDLPRCGPMLSPRVPNLVPIPGPRMERETPGQRPRPNYGHHRVRSACLSYRSQTLIPTSQLYSEMARVIRFLRFRHHMLLTIDKGPMVRMPYPAPLGAARACHVLAKVEGRSSSRCFQHAYGELYPSARRSTPKGAPMHDVRLLQVEARSRNPQHGRLGLQSSRRQGVPST